MPVPIDTNMIDTESSPIPSPTTSDENSEAERSRPPTPASPNVIRQLSTKSSLSTDAPSSSTATSRSTNSIHSNTSNNNSNVQQTRRNSRGQTTFQFYVPTSPPAESSHKSSTSKSNNISGSSNNTETDSPNNNWGSNRSGGSIDIEIAEMIMTKSSSSDMLKQPNLSKSFNSISRGASYGSGRSSREGVGFSSTNSLLRGIDPPEKELPTNVAAAQWQQQQQQIPTKASNVNNMSASEESARKARSRLIQLQKHGKSSSSQSTAASQQHGVQSQHHPSISGRKKQQKKERNTKTVADLDDSDEDDEDYPLVATDPIESDEDNETPPSNSTARRTSSSPIGHQQRNKDDPQSYMNNYPMSAPQPHRPTYKMPPQQIMQHLHAGGPNNIRGNRQSSSSHQGGIEPPPFGSGNIMHQQHQHQYIPTRKKKTPSQQQHQYNPQNKQQQLHRSLPQRSQPQQHVQQQPQPRRKSDGPYSKQHMMYTDGINLLEKTVSNDQGELTKEEVDTLNDGINYLRQLDQQDEMNKSNTVGRSSPVTPSSAQQQYSSSRRKKTAPPPPPPPPPPYNQGQQQQLIPTKLGNQQRSRPQQTKSRSNSLGNEMEKMATSGGKQRGHRPPPPPHNKPTSTPTSPTEQQRRRPIITAAAAMDYVMNAGRSTTPGLDYNDKSDESSDSLNTQESNDTQEFNEEEVAYLKAIMKTDDNNDEHDEGIDNSILIDDSSSSGASEYDTANEEQFERQSSFSIHVENTNKSSKYAEDKDYGDNNMRTIHHSKSKSIDNLDKLLLEEEEARQRLQQGRNMHSSAPSFHTLRRVAANKGEPTANNNDVDHVLRKSSMDPPDAEDDGEQSSEGLSPSVLPMRTMNERLYAVEAVIPTPTRMNDPYDTYVDESPDSFDQTMPRLGHNAHDDEGISRSLGPRSARAGGITGVCLDMSDTHQEEYPKPSMMDRMRTESPEESSSSSSSQSSTSIDAHDDEDLKNNPQSTLGSDPLSWDEEVNGDDALMLKLCSHLLPIGLNQSLNSLLIENKSMNQWDNEDPDEPGYVVHRLTNAQLISVENAFEKMVNTIECSSVKNVRDGTNSETFERDLEEAELILDQEEKRFESKRGTDPSPPDPSPNKSDDDDMELQFKQRQDEEEEQQQRYDSVPDFPGIYPPGKGKAGEMECFYLPIITKSEKTGFEPTKDLVLKPGSIFANNYLVQTELGSAAFSTAYRCLDLGSEEDEDGYQDEVCLKVIKNTKDYFDQSLDEIKILQLLKDTGRVHENNIVEMKSFFYHREHLVIVTELLRQNLYEFGKSILESRGPLYFTRQRLSFITRQCLVALKFVHELGLMHCDIKPENILLASYSRALVKVIDFGSSSFVTDRQSSYIQSRSYRAPEVILGLPYDGKLDVWSLGCCVAEMYTNEVTFQNDSELSMLSRIEAICGPFPRHMIAKGRNSHRIFTDSGLIYEKIDPDDVDDMDRIEDRSVDDANRSLYDVYQPKMTTMAARLGFDEDFMEQPKLSEDDQKRALFIDFVSSLLTVDPDARPSAAEALNHPWITSSLDLTEDDIKYGPERI